MADSLLITTLGGSTSNSMCTLAEADTYLTNSFYGGTYGTIPAEWDDMDDAEKESLLILAGLVMNGMSWVGWPVYEDQAMCWPRWLVYKTQSNNRLNITSWGAFADDESELFTADTARLPDAVKKAQAYIAYDVVWRGLQNRTSPSAGPASDAIKSISLFGDVSLSFDPGQEVPMRDLQSINGFMRARAHEIYQLLAPYVTEMNFIGHWDDWTPTLLDAVEV